MNINKEHIMSIVNRVGKADLAIHKGGVALSMTKLFEVVSIEELREVFAYYKDPTAVKFIDAVLKGDQGFYDSLLTSKTYGPYLETWEAHATERVVSAALKLLEEIMVDPESTTSQRMTAAGKLAAFAKSYTRQERKAERDFQEIRKKAKATTSAKERELEAQARAGVNIDADFDRIVSAPSPRTKH